MGMAGSAAEYERMTLASMEKAAEDVSDTAYHLKRAQIFATLASAAVAEPGEGDGASEDSGRSRRLRAG